jgi:hypothetical protein
MSHSSPIYRFETVSWGIYDEKIHILQLSQLVLHSEQSRVATVRFGSGSGTFWLNLNPNLGSGSGCN